MHGLGLAGGISRPGVPRRQQHWSSNGHVALCARARVPDQSAVVWVAQNAAGFVLADLHGLLHDGFSHAALPPGARHPESGQLGGLQSTTGAIHLPAGILGAALEPHRPQPFEAVFF